MNPRVEYAIGRTRGMLPIFLTRLLVALRWRLAWRNPAVRDNAIAQIAYMDGEIAAHGDTLMKFHDARDFVTAKRTGKLAVIYGF